MKSIWTAEYEDNQIKIENTWFQGERLFVNDILQDETFGLVSTRLWGHLFDKNGEKFRIKANIGGFLRTTCNVFVDDRLIEIIQQK